MYVSCEPCMMCMGAILYEEMDKLVYAATLQDSNDYYCPEMITNIEELAKYSKNKIEIVKELHRKQAVAILKKHKYIIERKILLSGTVLSSDQSSKDVFRNLCDIIGGHDFKKLPLEICSPIAAMKIKGNDSEKYESTMNRVKDANVVIAEMSIISTEQGMELQEAARLNIPTLVIAKSESKISNLIKGCQNVKNIIYYEDIYSIETEIIKFIEEELK